MKIKSLHIYLGIGVFAVVFLVVVVLMQSPKKQPPDAVAAQKTMPMDDVHKQGSTASPSKGNVSPEFIKEMNALKADADKNPKDTAKIREYAELAAQAHKPDEAILYFEKILKVNPRRTDIRMAIAAMYYSMQDFTKCEITLNSVLGYDKNNSPALFNLGIIAATKGDNEKAKNIWTDLIKKNADPEITKAAKEALNSLK